MGYFDKMEDDSLAVRLQTGVYMRLHGSKSTIEQVWPLTRTEQPEQSGPSWSETPQEMRDRIMEIYGVKMPTKT